MIDERPKGAPIVPDDYRRLGRLMTELGKRTVDLGVPLVYHHHMNSTGEKPHEVAAVLDAADKRTCGCCSTWLTTSRAAAIRWRHCAPIATGWRWCT